MLERGEHCHWDEDWDGDPCELLSITAPSNMAPAPVQSGPRLPSATDKLHQLIYIFRSQHQLCRHAVFENVRGEDVLDAFADSLPKWKMVQCDRQVPIVVLPFEIVVTVVVRLVNQPGGMLVGTARAA
jgi:hypothetical protein